jgi:CHASE1-domain containing sensor protein
MRRYGRDWYAPGFALGVLALALTITLTVYSICGQFVEREARLRFDNDSRSVEQQIAMRVRLYTDVLVTMRALFGEDADVTRTEFRDFVAGLDLPGRYPGFQTLNYAPFVRAADLPAFVAAQRKDPILQQAGIDFSVHPPGLRDGYDVLTYLEPLESNREAVGLDMSGLPLRRAAMERLRDTGDALSSGRLILDDRGAHFAHARLSQGDADRERRAAPRRLCRHGGSRHPRQRHDGWTAQRRDVARHQVQDLRRGQPERPGEAVVERIAAL